MDGTRLASGGKSNRKKGASKRKQGSTSGTGESNDSLNDIVTSINKRSFAEVVVSNPMTMSTAETTAAAVTFDVEIEDNVTQISNADIQDLVTVINEEKRFQVVRRTRKKKVHQDNR